MRRSLFALAFMAFVVVPVRADEVANLVTLARVWSAVKFFDPAMATTDIDWDAALVHAIPKVRAAKGDDELAAAIGGMLAELQDPASRVAKAPRPTAAADLSAVDLTRTEGDDVLVINVGPFAAKNGWAKTSAELRKLTPQITKKNLVIDLRTGGDEELAGNEMYFLESMSPTSSAVSAPAKRYAFHSGYAPQSGNTSGGYYSGILDVPGRSFQAVQNAPERVAFVTDRIAGLPEVALALHDAGRALIASTEPLGEDIAVISTAIPLPGGWRAEYRIAQLAGSSIATDLVDPDPVRASVAALRKPAMPSAGATVVPQAKARWRRDEPYRDTAYPDVEHRLLGAFRLWAVIHYFYPYLDLIGDWDGAFRDAIPHFIAAASADDYARAVIELDNHVEDGHSFVSGPQFVTNTYGGPGRLPAVVRLIENEFVVTSSDVPELRVGDIVDSVDGEPFRVRVDRAYKLVTGSRDIPRRNRAAATALRGPADSSAQIVVRRADGPHTVSVQRSMPKPPADSPGPPFRVLDGNIGYVDLKKLTTAQVDDMFESLIATRAIIFDLRGYPNGTAWPIAPRINKLHAKVGATFRRREVSGMSSDEGAAGGYFFDQPLPAGGGRPVYTGATVMLVDDRTISQAEHTGLFFEQASGTKFIGSPSAGANGDVTTMMLPGAVVVAFTGHDVRHADGRQLQRVGLPLEVEITPTIEGLRAGRDEVLDRAIQYLNATVH